MVEPNLLQESQQQKKEILEFSNLVGQPTTVSLLKGAIASNRVVPAYLFAGLDGVGKTLAASIFIAHFFGSNSFTNHPDLLWVEPTYLHQGELVNETQLAHSRVKRKSLPQIRVEQIRVITQFLSCSPLAAHCQVVVIQEAHQMAQAAANALLKTLEEPKSGVIILTSSQPQKVLPTIISRCQVVPFHRLRSADLIAVLERLGKAEILNNPIVVALAAGSPGSAIAHHNQLQSIPHTILNALDTPPTNALSAIQIAKEVDTVLEYHQQLWLLEYLQHCWWQRYKNNSLVSKVEEAKAALSKMASSRLVWEVLLLPFNTH